MGMSFRACPGGIENPREPAPRPSRVNQGDQKGKNKNPQLPKLFRKKFHGKKKQEEL